MAAGGHGGDGRHEDRRRGGSGGDHAQGPAPVRAAGPLPPPVRTPAGQREYGPDDVARVRVVRELLALGLTIEDVRAAWTASPSSTWRRSAPGGSRRASARGPPRS
ncbi:MerR family transcriptional regulator [Streptomyces sp. NPDC012950]|uniref:helix-turn-helix domain-containing protein n=1 Tax=Streptomyces sp. NPDC012950 TaxID=3364858 RepID=UPI0036BDA232